MSKKNHIGQEHWSHRHDFPDSEIWVTYQVIANFIAPRLRAFKSYPLHGYPASMNSEKQWLTALQKMIDAFVILGRDTSPHDDEEAIIEEGLDLFRKYYRDLWD